MTLPYITPKQQEIPTLLYKFRFLNRVQIQTLLHHTYHKRILDWLNDLTQKKYIVKLPKDNTFYAKTTPTVYRIGINGIRFLNIQEDYSYDVIKKLYKDKNRSDNFISNCEMLADIYLDLTSHTKDSVIYEVITSSDLINTESPFHFLKDVYPNLMYKETKKMKDRSRETYNLLTVFETTLPRYSIRKRIRTYLEFYFSNLWEDTIHKPFPTLQFICPTKTDLIYAKRYVKKLLEENQNPEDFIIELTIIDDVKKMGITREIWEAVPIQ